jgi:2-methylcitrate dehydratase PrpD
VLLGEVAEFALGLQLDETPEQIRARLGSLLVDHAAVCVAGRPAAAASIAADYASQVHPGDESVALLDGRRLAAAGAAWANGVLANVLDFDDGHRLAKGHPGANIIPAALAVADAVDAQPSELGAAILVGYEIALRAAVRQHERMPLYHASGSWGALGAAAAACRLLGLSEEQIGHALGLAEYHAPIALMSRAVTDPAMTKDAIGWGAFLGVSSAQLAAGGYTALSPTFLDGPPLGLGERWDLLDVYVKPYPCCRWSQPAIGAALQLRSEQPVRRIVIETFDACETLSRRRPGTTEEMQYSLTWPVAVALAEGSFGVDEVLRPPSPRASGLEPLIEVRSVPELTAAFPARRFSEVIVEHSDGSIVRSGRVEAGGEPDSADWQSVIDAKAARYLEPDGLLGILAPRLQGLLA